METHRTLGKCASLQIAIAAGLSMSGQAQAALNGPVRTDAGLVSGTVTDPSISVFRGVPYAAAPVGDLRFRPPAPAVPWQGVRSAEHPGLVCPRAPEYNSGPNSSGDLPVSEDCLNLDIYTGAQAAGEHRPVMVWFHGGTRGAGSTSNPTFDSTALAKKGAVVVLVNFRNGPLGLLATPELSRESGHNASGNYALMDDIAALKWIKRNIGAFGGDPENVTIFGESLGAGTVNFLALSPFCKGLFQRRITQSHSLYSHDPSMQDHGTRSQTLKEAEASGVQFMKLLGVKTTAELRKLPWETIYAAFVRSFKTGPLTGFTNDIPWTYVIDGYVIPRNYTDTFATHAQVDADALTGENRDENGAAADTAFDLVAAGKAMPPPYNTALLPLPQYLAFVHQRYGTMADEYLRLYPATSAKQAFETANAAIRDSSQVSPHMWAEQAMAGSKKHVYIYRFSQAPQGPDHDVTGAFHGADLRYVFNNSLPDWTDEDHRVADMMSSYWVNFARTGDPNGPNLPKWPAFNGEKLSTMELGGSYAPLPSPDPAKVDFWRRYYQSQPPL
ncbi:carboxylesterase family protein [Novosphingobium flavum]|uniref:Carboxylesterase family protein n=1 Tax=Novosphingobium flavum TaxID=1778672 RepID=A0A7X1FTG4_9SPHN|nr:carboxylesterase family protein [Novosphingobium flavum]MBC2666636.1 carboxylesterase family protein [Novosphingobium flavum]